MTTFEHGSRAARRFHAAHGKPKKYDIRLVDQFYVYCQAVAHTHRHRDQALVQSQFATRRSLGALLFAGGIFCYYLLERIAQLISV